MTIHPAEIERCRQDAQDAITPADVICPTCGAPRDAKTVIQWLREDRNRLLNVLLLVKNDDATSDKPPT